MKIISWNIRGLGSSVKKRFLSKLIKEREPDIVMIQETKLETIERKTAQKLWGSTEVGFTESGAIGASGGILILWNKELFKPQSITTNRHFIIVTGVLIDFECTLLVPLSQLPLILLPQLMFKLSSEGPGIGSVFCPCLGAQTWAMSLPMLGCYAAATKMLGTGFWSILVDRVPHSVECYGDDIEYSGDATCDASM
ncbi:hypothetical protein Vadar_031844 [Vaccinium darrowii]|nr:hypothetical protein Vadar_031844 [Vaccinium darrowii]